MAEREVRLKVRVGVPGLVRAAVLAAMGLWLLLGGCTTAGVRTAAAPPARSWEWCDQVQQNHPTIICFQR
jgi:hypothetical protein